MTSGRQAKKARRTAPAAADSLDRITAERAVRNHHIVPRMYLKQFAGEKLQLSVLGAGVGRLLGTKSTRQVAHKPNFYSLPQYASRAYEPEAVEDHFSRNIERKSAPVLKKLASVGLGELGEITPAERFDISRFVATQFVRTPQARQQLMAPRLMQNMIREFKFISDILGEPTLEAAIRLAGNLPDEIRNTAAYHAGQMAELEPVIGEALSASQWVLLETVDSLVASDNPVCVTTDAYRSDLLANTVWWLPVAPHRVLRIDTSVDANTPYTQDQHYYLAGQLNLMAAYRCESSLYFHPDLAPRDLDGLTDVMATRRASVSAPLVVVLPEFVAALQSHYDFDLGLTPDELALMCEPFAPANGEQMSE